MFSKKKTVSLPFYGGEGTLYVHDRTSMEVFHIKNSSTELCGCFMFATPSEDSMGVAHILEHTVLSGSGKYPVKDPFNVAIQSSPNTFLNAMTFPDKTIYPFASPLKKDFDNLFDIYADAVFNPLLRKTSFQQEGVRFFGPRFDGVVFNEMSGVRSEEDEIVQTFSLSKLFEGTPYQYDSGGDPYFIADLTYEEYLSRYRKWYSPSNCRFFLFGDLDASSYMEKIEKEYLGEENLKRWDGVKIIPNTETYKLKNCGFVRQKLSCSTKDANSVVLSWLTTPSADPVEALTINILVDILLGNPGAPLYKAIIDSDLGEDLSNASGTSSDYAYLPFTVGFSGAVKGKEDEIEAFLVSTLKDLAEKGLPEDLVKAILKRQEFSIREIPGSGTPFGLAAAIRSSRTWLRGYDVEKPLNVTGILEEIKRRVSGGRYFENWIMDNLVNNPNRCLLTVSEDPDYDRLYHEKLEVKLKNRKSFFSEEELKKEEKAFEEFVSAEDTEEQCALFKRIKVSDMPQSVPTLDPEKIEMGAVSAARILEKTNGITYLNLAFDAGGLSDEELLNLPLLLRLMQICNTKKHTYAEIGTLVKTYTGALNIANFTDSDLDGKPVSALSVSLKFLTSDMNDSLSLIREILFDGVLEDATRLRAAITDLVSDFASYYTYSGHFYATVSSTSMLSRAQMENELTGGTTGFIYLDSLKSLKNEELISLSYKLRELRDKLLNNNKLILQYCCDREDSETVYEGLLDFTSSLSVRAPGKVKDVEKEFVRPSEKYRYMKISSGPSFNSIAFKLPRMDEKFLVCSSLFASIVSSGYLWEEVRGKGGAYGVECHVNMQDKIFSFSSYRDPETEGTFRAFENCFSYSVSEEEIENTVVTTLGKELKPMTPQIKSAECFRRTLFGLSDSTYLKRRKLIMEATVEDVREVSSALEKQCRENSVRATIGSGNPPASELRTEVVELPL